MAYLLKFVEFRISGDGIMGIGQIGDEKLGNKR